MATVAPPPASERKRVKVYELKNNDWFDRGTGFCKGVVANVRLPTLATTLPRCTYSPIAPAPALSVSMSMPTFMPMPATHAC